MGSVIGTAAGARVRIVDAGEIDEVVEGSEGMVPERSLPLEGRE